MHWKKLTNGYLLIADKGEDVEEAILNFCSEAGVRHGFISGIGAVRDVELGYYDVELKEYKRKFFGGSFEVVSLLGNISLYNNKEFLHAHISLADRGNNLVGGHLFKATVSVTLEIFFTESKEEIIREDKGSLKLIR